MNWGSRSIVKMVEERVFPNQCGSFVPLDEDLIRSSAVFILGDGKCPKRDYVFGPSKECESGCESRTEARI